MKQLLIGTVVAFQFLTVLPPVIRRSLRPAELGAAVGFFPLVGLFLGLLLTGLTGALRGVLPSGVLAALLLGVWLLSTGALHFDGLLDTLDGLLGGWTADDRLRILRDVHVGAFAVAGGCILLLIKFSALQFLLDRPAFLLLPTVLGRLAMSSAIVLFPYARTQGLGRIMKDNAGRPQATVAVLLAAIVIAGTVPFIGWWPVVAAVVGAGLGAWLLIRFTLTRIPGLTGDIYGALCETCETICLVSLTISWES